MSCVSSMDVASSVVYFYPKLLALHLLNPEETAVPEQIRCTVEKLKDDGVYLLDNGMHMLLYVGITANPAFIQVRTTTTTTRLSQLMFSFYLRMCLEYQQLLKLISIRPSWWKEITQCQGINSTSYQIVFENFFNLRKVI